MGHEDGFGGSLPSYTTLSPVQKGSQSSAQFGEIKTALKDFLVRHPEMASDPRKLETLQYCFKHYINFDPEYRDLSLQEKFERAGQMAMDFLGSMFKV